MFQQSDVERHVANTRQWLVRMVGGSPSGAGQQPGAATGNNAPGAAVPGAGGGAQPPNAAGNPGGGGRDFWGHFFGGLTLTGLIMTLGGLLAVYAAYRTTVPNDLNLNRVKNEGTSIEAEARKVEAIEARKKAKILASVGAIPNDATFVPQPHTLATQPQAASEPSCLYAAHYDSYLIPAGKCITFDNTNGGLQSEQYLTISGTETPVTSVSGGDFTVITADKERLSCDSRQSADRCTSWIKEHQKQGDKGRYWYMFKVPGGQKVIINTFS